jgi:glutamate synthase domain-containing protein 2
MSTVERAEFAMATLESKRWVCMVCGYIHEGDAPPEECPVCGAPAEEFELEPNSAAPTGSQTAAGVQDASVPQDASRSKTEDLADYLAPWARKDDDFETKYAHITALALGRESPVTAMRTQKTFPDWSAILFRGGQLYRLPLNEDEEVITRTVIGPGAARPLELAIPFYVSHMSFGALSREAKIALARGSRRIGTVMCSGEGGLLPVERQEAGLYIYELGTATFSHRRENIEQADAVEIKIGQAAKPGLGGHLPAEKVTPEIAQIRGIPSGEPSISPGRHAGLDSPEALKARVAELRRWNGGRPIGIKFAAGHVEEDLEYALLAEPDFITIDCRGGGTGAAPVTIKDNVCLPPIFALRRARRYLDGVQSQVTLCVTGGFRDAADIAKALALGADAVALATASLIAIGCQQYRICHTGRCPVGITTQDHALRERLDVDRSVQRFVNFYHATTEELKTFARINGRRNVHELDLSDVVTISNEISRNTDVPHA